MERDLLKWEDDGLPCLEDVGPWVEEKYRLLFNCIQMFSTGMKGKWKKRVYVDLYAGPGCAKVARTNRILRGSPLLALSVQDKFSKYIFCDTSEAAISALRERVRRRFRDADVQYVIGDCNEKVDEIIASIPSHSKSETVLSFCFVDPFDLGIHFRTIETLARRKLMDFLMLLALFMDANRNERHYTTSDNRKVDKFLDDPGWRAGWIEFRRHDSSFPRFLAREFEKKMLSLDYLKSKKGNTKEFRSNERNLPLYHLAFFSRHQRGYDFWEEGLRYISEPPFDFDV